MPSFVGRYALRRVEGAVVPTQTALVRMPTDAAGAEERPARELCVRCEETLETADPIV